MPVLLAKETKDLTGKAGVVNLQLWEDRIKGTLDFLKTSWNGYDSWRSSYLLDRAVHWGMAENISADSKDLDAEIVVPLIATHIRNLMPFLFSKNPKFFGVPANESDEAIRSAKMQLDYLNAMWRDLRMTKQARRSILDAAIIGHGIARTGWGIEGEFPETEDPENEGRINYTEYIKKENPFVRRINPFLFIFDRHAPDSDLNTARWCSELLIMTVQDIIDNKHYDKKLRKKIETGEVPLMQVSEFNSKYHKESSEDETFLFANKNTSSSDTVVPDTKCMLYKVYDRKFNNVFTKIPGYNEGLLSLNDYKETYGHLDSFPYAKVDFEEIPNESYGMGHTRYLADLQAQLNRHRTKVYGWARMFNPKYVHKGEKPLDQASRENINGDVLGSVVEMGLSDSLEAFPTPHIDNTMQYSATLIDKDYAEVSGEDVLSRGGLLPSRTSAEEIRERRRLRGLRLETNVENTHEFVLELADQLIKHTKRYATKSVIVRTIGRKGEYFTNVDPTTLKEADITLDMEIISKPAEEPQMKYRRLLEVFTMLSNPNIYNLLKQSGVPVDINRLWNEMMETLEIKELLYVFPGMTQMSTLPDIPLINSGTPPNPQTDNPSTTQSQLEGVSPISSLNGIDGIQSLLNPPGSINPSRF